MLPVRILTGWGAAGGASPAPTKGWNTTAETDGGVGSVKLANGIASLGVSRGRNGASVDDDDVSGSGRGCGRATAVEQLALDGGAIGLRGAATELFDEEG